MVAPHAFVDEGLGNSSYLVEVADSRALVVDPSRHPTRYLKEAERRGLHIAFAVETHLHADFVSGARELGALGASLLVPGEARHAFSVRGLRDGDEVDLGGLTLQPSGPRATRPNTSPTSCSTARSPWRCSQVARCWRTRSPGPTSSTPTAPKPWPGRCGGRCKNASSSCPTTCRSTRPTGRVRSAPRPPAASGSRPSGGRSGRTRSWPLPTRTPSSPSSWAGSGPTRRTSCACAT